MPPAAACAACTTGRLPETASCLVSDSFALPLAIICGRYHPVWACSTGCTYFLHDAPSADHGCLPMKLTGCSVGLIQVMHPQAKACEVTGSIRVSAGGDTPGSHCLVGIQFFQSHKMHMRMICNCSSTASGLQDWPLAFCHEGHQSSCWHMPCLRKET
jgi:hypothetical protein